MIKTTGMEKDYELIEYILNVNTQYTQVLMELNENGAMDGAYTYGTSRLTEDRFTGESNFYLYDPSGNVAGITDQNGYLWQSYRYDAFGNATFGSPQYDNEYTFNGESYNPNIHSQYLRARYYDTVKGGFLTEDSYLGDIRNPLTLNRYSYCIGNPLFYSDSSGHFPTDYEVTDTVREKLEEDILNDTKNSRLNEYQRYELYEERKNAYEGLNYTGFWDTPWFSEEEQRISYMVDLDYGNPKHRRLIKLAAETAKNMTETERCMEEEEKKKEALAVIKSWQNDRSLSTHDVYESIKILGETMTSEEIMSHISVRERLWVDMIEYGYTEVAAAGNLGNIYVESAGYVVGRLQGNLTELTKGLGMGLCQWSWPSRQQELYAMADEMGLTWDTYEVQVAFIFKEIETYDAFEKARPEKLNKAMSVEQATGIFMEEYENPGEDHFDWRKEEAEKVYADYATGR